MASERLRFLSLALSVALLGACAEIEPSSEQAAAAIEDGGDVSALQAYLRRYGYLPNPALAKDYPRWRPIIDAAPEPGVFDAVTRRAVRALQVRSGLRETGSLDAATRALLAQPRCSVPEGLSEDESHDKFHAGSRRIEKSNITWKLTNTDDVTFAQAHEAVAFAFAVWRFEMDVTFTEVTASTAADITISFSSLGCCDVGGTTQNTATPKIYLNSDRAWSVNGARNTYDVSSVTLHELGHALGLHHSSIEDAVMWPALATGEIQRFLSEDDRVAIRTLYDGFAQVPGLAHDIGAFGTDVWHIGTLATGDGYRIYKWVNGQWAEASGGGGAVRIAVDALGNPWVVTRNGSIWFHAADHTYGGWNWHSGCAKDIGAGADGSVWIVTCTVDHTASSGPLGYRVAKENGGGWTEDVAPNHALRIAVGPDGRPWTALANGVIQRRRSAEIGQTGWDTITPGTAGDIAVDGGGHAWIIGLDAQAGGSGIYVRNDQEGGSFGGQPAEERHEWVRVPGGAYTIAAGQRAVWVANASLSMYKLND